MSDFIPAKEFDQLSGISLKSQISQLNFSSPLPLPRNASKIPSNEQIGDIYEKIEQQFGDVEVDKMVSMIYNNVIVPKIPEGKTPSERFSHQYKQENQSVRSRASNISSVTTIKPSLLSFKVHPNNNITTNNQSKVNENSGMTSAKKKRSKKKEEVKQMGVEIKRNPKGENEQNLRKAQSWKSQDNKQHQLFSKNTNMQFCSKQEQVRYVQKKLAAKAFCQRGYGMQKLKAFVWQTEGKVYPVDKRRYKLMCNAFVSESYRKLQQFLIEDCGRNIKPLTGPEVRALHPILLGSQLKFQDDEYLTFRKFVSVAYDLGSVPIFQQMAIKLYIKVQLCLRGRIGLMKLDRQYRPESKVKREMLKSPGRFLNQRLENESIWTTELEYVLIDTVTEQKTIAKTRDKLKLKYGDNAVLNNVKQLKARFFKILRISAKRLIRYASEYAHKVPLLVQLDDDKIKVLIRHPAGRQARFALGRLYKTRSFDALLLADVINKVNQFCYVQETRRQTQEKSRQPVINSITDKIKHNIKVSKKMLKSVTTPAQRAGPDSELVYLKRNESNYQHIVSLQHNDKLHYFRKTGALNNKGGFEYEEKASDLKKLEMQDGDDDSEQLVMLSDDDYVTQSEEQEQ